MIVLKDTSPAVSQREQIGESIRKEQTCIGTYRRRIDGGKMFRYCKETGSLTEAEFKSTGVFVVGGANKEEIAIEKNSLYVEALNAANAAKRIKAGKIAFIS